MNPERIEAQSRDLNPVKEDSSLRLFQDSVLDAGISKRAIEAQENAEKDLPSVSRDVAASPDEVWKAIGKFDTLSWHPGIESGTVATDSNGDMTRTLVAKGGSPVFVEQLLEQEPNSLKYKMISGLPLQPTATLRVEPNATGGSRITWEAQVEGADPKAVEAVTSGVLGFYAAGLDQLAEKFKK